MNVSVVCTDNMKKVIEEILKSKDFEISDDSEIIFVEKGLEKDIKNNVYISFDINNLNSLLNFLEAFSSVNNNSQNLIAAKSEEKFELFSYDKIQFFEADNNNVYCIIKDEKTPYKIKEKLYKLEEKLDPKIFIRVSKSNIVNVMNISEIVPWFSSKMLLKFKGSGRKVEVTRSYLKKFKEHLGL